MKILCPVCKSDNVIEIYEGTYQCEDCGEVFDE